MLIERHSTLDDRSRSDYVTRAAPQIIIMSSEIAPIRPARRALEPTTSWLDRVLFDFDGSSLEQLDRVALLNRTDTKFLLSDSDLLSLLPSLAREYRVLDISAIRRHPYRTVYFDTPEWDLYNQHRTAQI